MRTTKNFLAGMAALALMASPALAQPGPGWQGHMSGPEGSMPGWQGHMSGPEGSMPGGMGPYHHYGYRNGGGHGRPPWGWRRGDHFYGPRPVIIHNYGYYHLLPPPPGYYWVQTDGQFLMIAVATGLIVNILTAPVP